ncbi:MAG TPA: radical SAM/SPASM domain-containing protein [Pseudomonadota bacterium]|nr:radical SAM/SPASM domain-containing protein [Pseudomonadota bacterium]
MERATQRSVYFGAFDAERSWDDPQQARLPALPSPLPDCSIAAMDELLMALCDPDRGDVLVTRRALLPEHREHLRGLGLSALAPPSAGLRQSLAALAPGHHLVPWAVTAEVASLWQDLGVQQPLPPLAVVQRVNSKVFSTALRQRLRLPGRALLVQDAEQLAAAGAELLASAGAVVIKEPLGVSGRGTMLVESAGRLGRLISALRSQAQRGLTVQFIVEPFLRRRLDFSAQLHIEPDGQVHLDSVEGLVNRGFAYAASCPLPAEELRLLRERGHTHAVLAAARAVAEEGYFGPLGIDGMVLEDGTLIPLGEINARGSLGMLNRRLDQRAAALGSRSYLTAIRVAAATSLPFATLVARLDEDGLLARPDRPTGLVLLTARTLPFAGEPAGPGAGARVGRLFVCVLHRRAEEIAGLLARAAAVLATLGFRLSDPLPEAPPPEAPPAVPWDDRSLSRLGERVRSLARTRRGLREDPAYAPALPEEVGLQLTNRCNLRCAHCYQWNETGHHHHLPLLNQRDELDIAVVEQIFAATRPARSKLYLWGGEPLVYRHWDRLAALLADDPRWTVLCTNGIGLENKLDSILRISQDLVALISLDGFAPENDAIRGPGTHARILRSIDLLLDLKRRGSYRGEVSVSAILSEALIPRLLDFAEFLEQRRINTLYLVFPWYIPPPMAQRMDAFFAERFAWLREQRPELLSGRPPSWHSYQFHVDAARSGELVQQMQRIARRDWRIRVRFQPALEADEVEGFLRGSDRPGQGRSRCTSVATRMNVLADGGVTTCKLFPEFTIGRLEARPESVAEVWRGPAATRARSEFACGLMPICSKCVQLYLHGLSAPGGPSAAV